MALGLYCELNELSQSDHTSFKGIESVHDEALKAVQCFYADHHVLPYCGKGHFYLRQGKAKDAINCYAKAAQVASR